MPKYAKFMKELLKEKKSPEDNENVTLNEECSTMIQNRLPHKLKDLSVFKIPCEIGTQFLGFVLADTGLVLVVCLIPCSNG